MFDQYRRNKFDYILKVKKINNETLFTQDEGIGWDSNYSDSKVNPSTYQHSPVQNLGSSEKSPQSFFPSQYLSRGRHKAPPLHGNSDILHDSTNKITLKFNNIPQTMNESYVKICKYTKKLG